jgi:hypothetical protein
LRSGKDHLANLIPWGNRATFSEPLYALADHFFGSDLKKSDPGYRTFLTHAGQYGRRIISDQYPLSTERAAFINAVRNINPRSLDFKYRRVNWSNYGRSSTFWAELLCNSEQVFYSDVLGVVVTGHRFHSDEPYLIKEGFTFYLVACSEETRKERLTALNEPYDGNPNVERHREHLFMDISEAYATKLTNQFLYPHLPWETPMGMEVIWNDHRLPPPTSGPYLTIHEFLNRHPAC